MHEAWEKLLNIHVKTETVVRLILRRKWQNVKYSESEPMETFLWNFSTHMRTNWKTLEHSCQSLKK